MNDFVQSEEVDFSFRSIVDYYSLLYVMIQT